MHIMCGCRCDNKAQTLTKSSPGIHYTDVQIFNVQVQKVGRRNSIREKANCWMLFVEVYCLRGKLCELLD